MAYISQNDKKELAPAIKAVLKKYKMKGSIAVKHYSTLVVNLKSGELDMMEAFGQTEYQRDYIQVNPYWIERNWNDDTVVAFLLELKSAMEGPKFYNNDDSMTDYFDRSHFVDINVGTFKSNYTFTA
tara:strand:- start:3407 stop:3787 length:381 start_codon:yes stop_codon:yes gene_type:complete